MLTEVSVVLAPPDFWQFNNLMMDAASNTETSVKLDRSTRRNNPESNRLQKRT
jgi:hypothetical protein